MSYSKIIKDRDVLIEQADNISNEYLKIAHEIMKKCDSSYSKFSGIIHEEIDECGIKFEYYRDNYDYSSGRYTYFVSAERINKHIRYSRIQRIQQLIKNKNAIVQKIN